MFFYPFSTQQQDLLNLLLAQMIKLSSAVNIVFHLRPEEKFGSSRHTYPFYPEMELLVILATEKDADDFYEKWIVELVTTRKENSSRLNRVNLQIISEKEFIDELDSLEQYKERVLRSRIVFDKEAHLYN